MQTSFTLPDGYVQGDYVNLYADRRIYRNLNIASFIIGVAVIAVGWLWQGIDPLLALLKAGMHVYFCWLLTLAGCTLAYLTLHELTHGLMMRLFSGICPHYGKKGLLLFAGSEAYFRRRDYLSAKLSPVVLFGIVFALLSVILKDEWFWLAIVLQLINFGSSVGDIYTVCRALRQPKNALYYDSGVSVTIYTEIE